ncbi:hypothetical protein FRC06_010138 [Ceratobasidium sp. 370]|nr:hypothetical protein FRC06_010138 [Ceratobasidium sp. 370]
MAEVTGQAQEENKITLLKGWTKSAATYCIINETHTIGNTLRWMLMKKSVVFHAESPSPALMIFMKAPKSSFVDTDEEDSLEALITALENLDQVTAEIGSRFDDSVEAFMHD